MRAADAVVPCHGLGREGGAPDLADERGVVCMVHMKVGEAALHLRERRGSQAEAHVARGGGCVRGKLAGAAQRGVGWNQGVEKGALVVPHGVADKGAPVGLAEPLAHAKVVSDA